MPPVDPDRPLFEFDRVGLVAGDRIILDQVSLEIPSWGITVVTGPSGSGKSTLARLTNRLTDPSSGLVRFRGIDLTELDVLELRRAVGLVFQQPTTFPGTVADNLSATGVEDRARWCDLLSAVRLDPGTVLDQEATTLSGGEAQRVCMVRTLLLEPQVLVADEVTSSVDAGARVQLEALARRLADGGTPVLWITHDLEQLRRLADHLVVLVGGTVHSSGPTDTLLAPGRLDLESVVGGARPDGGGSDGR